MRHQQRKVVDGAEPTYWFGRLRVDESALAVDKAQFHKALAAEGVPCGLAYVTPLYKKTRTLSASASSQGRI